MIAWAHVLAWPIAAVLVSTNARRGLAALALALWPEHAREKPLKP